MSNWHKYFLGGILILLLAVSAQGCASSKGCGCGTDINRAAPR